MQGKVSEGKNLSYLALLAVLFVSLAVPWVTFADSCAKQGVALQVLGSGGPELTDHRASSAYLLWQDGRARVLVDLGAGSMLNFERSGAKIEDLDYVLLTHLHVDHTADLPSLIKGSFFEPRNRNLPLYGPSGNEWMPATEQFVRRLFANKTGAYRYLGDYLSGEAKYQLIAHTVDAQGRTIKSVVRTPGLNIDAIPVHHGPIPALAWRIALAGKVVTISGDMNGDYNTLEKLAKDSDLLVAHHPIPEDASGVARNLHMPPSVIGRIALEANVGQLVLSHRMRRTLGREQQSTKIIRELYKGKISFADDGSCYPLK